MSFIVARGRVFGSHCASAATKAEADDEKEPLRVARRSHFEVLPRENQRRRQRRRVPKLSRYLPSSHRDTHLVLFHFQAASYSPRPSRPLLPPALLTVSPRSCAHPKPAAAAQVLVLSGFVCNFSRVFRDYNLTTPATKRSCGPRNQCAHRDKSQRRQKVSGGSGEGAPETGRGDCEREKAGQRFERRVVFREYKGVARLERRERGRLERLHVRARGRHKYPGVPRGAGSRNSAVFSCGTTACRLASIPRSKRRNSTYPKANANMYESRLCPVVSAARVHLSSATRDIFLSASLVQRNSKCLTWR